jgi:hypothetical protein
LLSLFVAVATTLTVFIGLSTNAHSTEPVSVEPAPVVVSTAAQKPSTHGKKVVLRPPWMHRVHGQWRVHPRKLAWHLNKKWFGVRHWRSLDILIWREARWQPFEPGKWGKMPLMNRGGSGACGLPQALPCGKIPNPRSVLSQLRWMMRYIKGRYINPTRALAFHYAHNYY